MLEQAIRVYNPWLGWTHHKIAFSGYEESVRALFHHLHMPTVEQVDIGAVVIRWHGVPGWEVVVPGAHIPLGESYSDWGACCIAMEEWWRVEGSYADGAPSV